MIATEGSRLAPPSAGHGPSQSALAVAITTPPSGHHSHRSLPSRVQNLCTLGGKVCAAMDVVLLVKSADNGVLKDVVSS